MSLIGCEKELLTFLEQPNFQECTVVVMPDLFLDRLVDLQLDVNTFYDVIKKVVSRNGGSIDGIVQTDILGGNAINTASALTCLDAIVIPIVCTSNYGLSQIRYRFRNGSIDTSYIKCLGKESVTTALEFKNNNEKTNVMIRDLGALAEFSPSQLSSRDYDAIEQADYTCVFNWAGTLNSGTKLVDEVFSRVKLCGHGKTYYDTADPNPNIQGVAELIRNVLKTSKVDFLSVNENEAITYACQLDPALKDKRNCFKSEFVLDAARILAKNFSARIDLHTTTFSGSFKGNYEVVVPAFKVNVLRATGAGDAWNAGNIVAQHNGLSDKCRLLLANALAAFYLSSPTGIHPDKTDLSNFMRTYSGSYAKFF